MPNTPHVIEGGYLRDILAQPRALEDTLAGLEITSALRAAAARRFDRVVLTGMGGSFWALEPLRLRLLRNGVTALSVETSELLHVTPGILDERTLLVAVSQSGRSAETVRLLDVKRRECFTIGVTNTPGSPLALHSDAVVLTHAGEEFTVSCKTYVATLMALEWLGGILAPEDRADLPQAAPLAAAYLNRWREHVAEAAVELEGVRDLFILGRGASLAAAGTGGLITKESAHFHSEGMSAAAFRHGPFEMLGPSVYALVFAGDAATAKLNAGLVRDIVEAGGRAALVSEDAERAVFRLPRASAALRPILEILPVEMFTLALAALAGREAGKFERATKVTTTE